MKFFEMNGKKNKIHLLLRLMKNLERHLPEEYENGNVGKEKLFFMSFLKWLKRRMKKRANSFFEFQFVVDKVSIIFSESHQYIVADFPENLFSLLRKNEARFHKEKHFLTPGKKRIMLVVCLLRISIWRLTFSRDFIHKILRWMKREDNNRVKENWKISGCYFTVILATVQGVDIDIQNFEKKIMPWRLGCFVLNIIHKKSWMDLHLWTMDIKFYIFMLIQIL